MRARQTLVHREYESETLLSRKDEQQRKLAQIFAPLDDQGEALTLHVSRSHGLEPSAEASTFYDPVAGAAV